METQQTQPKRNPTPRQRKAAREVVKNLLSKEPISTGQILENVGYSKGVTETPKMVLETDGFKTALAETGLRTALEAEGINPKKIAEKINVLLDAADERGIIDYTAVDKGLKHATAIYGITEDKPKGNQNNTYNFIFSKDVQDNVRLINDQIKAKLISNEPYNQSQTNMETQQEG